MSAHEARFIVPGLGDMREELQQLAALPSVAKAMDALERQPVTLEVRRRSNGWRGWRGRAFPHVSLVAVTLPDDCTMPIAAMLLAHELAHIASADGEAHGPAWRSMYLRILHEGCGIDVDWPTTGDGRRFSIPKADEFFVGKIGERWS